MSGGIYLVGNDGNLVKMNEQSYDAEDRLQSLLEEYPDLLAGDQINPSEPRRWVLVSREAGVPSEEGGYDRWFLDHLFLDQDAVPTLVEVKRSTDTRIRREVVGQMLDYAANALEYWPIETITEKFRDTCSAREADADSVLEEFLGGEVESGEFWERTRSNLEEGRIRLLFVSDEIPGELRRTIEFLNSQMDRTEVLGIEIKQFVGPEGQTTFVSRVVGQTARADIKKRRGGPKGDEETFFRRLSERVDEEDVAVARKLLQWASSRATRVYWGAQSLNPRFVCGKHMYTPIALYDQGTIWVNSGYLHRRPAFADPAALEALVHRFAAIPETAVPADPVNQFPSIALAALRDGTTWARFVDWLNWVAHHIQEFHTEAKVP